MIYILSLALFFPLAGFLGLVSSYKIIGRRIAGIIACSTILLSLACFTVVFVHYLQNEMQKEQFTLFSFPFYQTITIDFSLHIDSLSLLMALLVTSVGLLIHIYSMGYMDHEEDYPRYFAFLNLFVFSMLLLVLAGHLFTLFVGWEGVGLASYFLIGFWYVRPAAAQAATKAFIVNRIGDLAFLLALILTFYMFGTGDIAEISENAGKKFAVSAPLITLVTLLYFIGATGKSAQGPLYCWLPDAMEGPTPVSALIHAATMVTAGVYLVVRLHAVFVLAPITLQVVGIVGGVTSLFAALCALGQTDLKRVLAFSTVSQLGLMFLACGAGAFYSAMFHLTTHAFIKALLFLSAGNVVHMMHGTTEMAKMGGLSKIFTKTHWLFLVGVFALAGIPPLAAFFSKDLILEHEYMSGYQTLFYVGLASSILTGVYMMRAYCLTFLGPLHLTDEEREGIHEAPKVMLFPVVVLAFLACFAGILGYTFDRYPMLENFLRELGITPIEEVLHSGYLITPETWMAMTGAFLGVGLTAFVYIKYADCLGQPLDVLKRQFYINEIYDWTLVKPLRIISRTIVQIFEPKVFEESIAASVNLVQGTARNLQVIQSGQIRSYISWMVLGAVLLIVYFSL